MADGTSSGSMGGSERESGINGFSFFSFLFHESDCFLTKSSKSPASIEKSNKQWVGTCLYQEECKRLLINCGAVIWL